MAAVAAVPAGISIAERVFSLVDSSSLSVVARVEVSNNTKFALSADGYYTAWGQIQQHPVSIHPSKTEAIIGQKTTLSTAGTTGVAAWKIGDTHKRLIVMWSVPWSHAVYSNVLAVGLTESKARLDNQLYNTMYHENKPWFQRTEYTKGKKCLSVTHITGEFKVTGSMGTTCKTVVNVSLEEHEGSDINYNWDCRSESLAASWLN